MGGDKAAHVQTIVQEARTGFVRKCRASSAIDQASRHPASLPHRPLRQAARTSALQQSRPRRGHGIRSDVPSASRDASLRYVPSRLRTIADRAVFAIHCQPAPFGLIIQITALVTAIGPREASSLSWLIYALETQ